MPQQPSTVLLRGGLNLVSPPMAIPPGQCSMANNYEPEVTGYRRIGGIERFDGQTAPSTGTGSMSDAGTDAYSLERASTASYYNVAGVLSSAAVDTARLDYHPVTHAARGILLEGAATNLMLHSGDLSNAAWGKTRSSITSNAIAAPDGTMTGDKLVENTDNNSHYTFESITVVSGTTYTLSVFAKAAERSIVQLVSFATPLALVSFDVSAGTIAMNGDADVISAAIEDVGGGWYRCSMTFAATASGSLTYGYALSDGSPAAGTLDTYAGNGTSGLYLWGGQMEAGAAATSYIPTVAATVTRSADTLTLRAFGTNDWDLDTSDGIVEFNSEAGDLVVDLGDLTVDAMVWLEGTAVLRSSDGLSYMTGNFLTGEILILDYDAMRMAIGEVPGTGPVLGVWCYAGEVWAFRKNAISPRADIYKATASGWEEVTPGGYLVPFKSGTAGFVEGETFTSSVLSRTGTVHRVVLAEGQYSDSDAQGYLIVTDLSGALTADEVLTGSESGSVTTSAGVTSLFRINWAADSGNGPYQFVNHNFYGSAIPERMYFCTGGQGDGHAYEWDGEVLTPVHSYAWSGDPFPGMQTDIIKPRFIGQYRNHLMLAVGSSLIHSGVGEPLSYLAVDGAGEIPFGEQINGVSQSLAGAFFIQGKSRISYLAGNDSSDFQLLPLSSTSGAYFGTAQGFGESPLYLDDAGVRKATSIAGYGDFRTGTLTQLVEPYIRKKRKDGVTPVGSLVLRGKDQYRLFYDDMTGLIVYMGRKSPEAMPFSLPIQAYCMSAGELDGTAGERYFIGGEDGYVYEMDSGTSFDGAPVSALIQINWHALSSPNQNKRMASASIETDSEDDIDLTVAFKVDYNIPGNHDGTVGTFTAEAGRMLYDSISDATPAHGILKIPIDGFGRNIAIAISSEHTYEQPHTISSLTVNFSQRGLIK